MNTKQLKTELNELRKELKTELKKLQTIYHDSYDKFLRLQENLSDSKKVNARWAVYWNLTDKELKERNDKWMQHENDLKTQSRILFELLINIEKINEQISKLNK